ncbi:putative RNA-directed DNA polymerase, eukaryota, reverse transcriptase zinc-binding domain protein [Tanacetum coccineum]
MNVASININRVGTAPKKEMVRNICRDNHFIGIQESKTTKEETSLIHSLWGNTNCGFVTKNSVGSSAIYGEWVNFGMPCLMIIVYAPQDMNAKCALWNSLVDLIRNFQDMCIVLGDFNELRVPMDLLLCSSSIIGVQLVHILLRWFYAIQTDASFQGVATPLVPKKQDPLYINDYRPISLIGCQYKVIAKFLADRLKKVVHSVASKKNERLFLFKVDFEKAFDSLDWNLLDNVMQQMEFDIQCGIHQGDPLSPFLFIIAVKALHVTFQEAKAKGIFDGVKIGSNKVDVSQLQFADDALILGKWSLENARTLCRILKVNFSKSKLFGVGVDASDIQGFANILDCQASTFPCSYLGLPIGASMSKACNWKPIIEKFHKRLYNTSYFRSLYDIKKFIIYF